MPSDGTSAPSAIGRYRLLSVLGAGGMATVHLARLSGERGFQRLYALKCCHPQYEEDESFAAMFLDEARLAARIHHPNVVSTLDFGTEGGRTFLVMDYVEGVRALDLQRHASRGGGVVPVEIVLRIVVDTLSGLHAAHELTTDDGAPLGVVHRDVSPHNVLVGLDGVSRVIDFGIAKAAERASVTEHGLLKGKIAYMSPEQLSGDVDRRTDVFAVGVVMWELLVGRRLFSGPSREDVVRRVLEEPIAAPSEARADTDPKLDALVLRALQRDREKRYATAQDFVEALESSGVRIATPREVGRWVDERFGAEIRERRKVPELVTGPTEMPTKTAMPVPMRSRSGRAVLGLASLAIATVVGAGLWWALGPEVDARPVTEPPVATRVLPPLAEPPLAPAPPPPERAEPAPSPEPAPTPARRPPARRRREAPGSAAPAAPEGPAGAWFPSGP